MYTRQLGGNRRVTTPNGPANLVVHLVGPHPIVRHFLDRMGFHRIVRSCLGTDRDRLLDYAQSLSVLVQNIILSPAPLYRIAEWAAPIDSDALGLSDKEKLSINDDRIARTLDVLVSARAKSLFFRLALHIIKQFEIDTQRIHHDTTTVTFYGQYQTSWREPRITYGVNKDHRPDLKQLVFGLNVTADGAVPISHDIYNGNRTDDSIHRDNLDRIRQIVGRDDFIYVADSKLCTRKNLGHIDDYGGKFVTVLPHTRAEDKHFREALRRGDLVRWRKLLEIENKRRSHDPPDIYWTSSDGPEQTVEGYRIVWLRSSQKMSVDAQARETALRKTGDELFSLNNRLNRGKLRQRSFIKSEVKKTLQKYNCQGFFQVHIVTETHIEKKRARPGRPKQSDPAEEFRVPTYRLEVRRDKEALKSQSRTDGVFPLVTNLKPTDKSKKDVVLIYKYQPYVEKRHALFKSELEVAPVFIKKPLRAAGLIHAAFVAMTLDALIERTLRQNMHREGIESLPILPEGRPTKTPTTARILEMFSNVSWYQFERAGEVVTFPISLTPLQKQLLTLLQMDPTIYS
jgi:transposase